MFRACSGKSLAKLHVLSYVVQHFAPVNFPEGDMLSKTIRITLPSTARLGRNARNRQYPPRSTVSTIASNHQRNDRAKTSITAPVTSARSAKSSHLHEIKVPKISGWHASGHPYLNDMVKKHQPDCQSKREWPISSASCEHSASSTPVQPRRSNLAIDSRKKEILGM